MISNIIANIMPNMPIINDMNIISHHENCILVSFFKSYLSSSLILLLIMQRYK